MDIRTNKSRLGNFTSSEIAALMSEGKAKDSIGKPFYTYVKEKQRERRLGRSLNNDSSARPLTWGKLVEMKGFELLGTEYGLYSDKTIIHPDCPFWSGSPDGIIHEEEKVVFDLKCPYTLNSFCELAECKNIDEVRANHKDGEKYYFQLVSNAILTGCNWGELIVYCPYKSELESIKEMANNWDGDDQKKYAWIWFADDEELPYLIDGEYYPHLVKIRFPIPQSDKEALTERVKLAGELLCS